MSQLVAIADSPERDRRVQISLRRIGGFANGVGTQALFAFTVVGLFSFLRYGVQASPGSWVLIDTLLALQFAVPHSVLLHPTTRRRLKNWISPEFHGAFFCLVTCLSLLLIFRFWRGTSVSVWDLHGTAASGMVCGFYLSWAGLLYSISLTGFGFQTGWTQWRHWYRGEKMPRRDFTPRSVYRVMRHPVYLSFLGLIWFTPTMSLDRALLTGIWTVYIGIGSVLKDQRLVFYLGDTYRSYMQRVAGFPLIRIGPLARVAASTITVNDGPASTVASHGPDRISYVAPGTNGSGSVCRS